MELERECSQRAHPQTLDGTLSAVLAAIFAVKAPLKVVAEIYQMLRMSQTSDINETNSDSEDLLTESVTQIG